MARRGLTQASPFPGFAEEAAPPLVIENGWFQLPNREGVIVTKELVDRLIEEADLEDVGIRKGE
jgi:hypothetical protein